MAVPPQDPLTGAHREMTLIVAKICCESVHGQRTEAVYRSPMGRRLVAVMRITAKRCVPATTLGRHVVRVIRVVGGMGAGETVEGEAGVYKEWAQLAVAVLVGLGYAVRRAIQGSVDFYC